MKSDLEHRLDELESRLTFQDDLLEILNETVTRQDREILAITRRLKELDEKLTDLAEQAGSAGDGGDEAPPHY